MGGEETHSLPRRLFQRPRVLTFRPSGSPLTLDATKDVVLRGRAAFSFSSFLDGGTQVVLLAHDRVEALYRNTIVCPAAQCVLKARVKHDAPKPVQARFVVDGRTQGIVTWDRGDNTYEEKMVPGIIPQGRHTLAVRLVRDIFRCSRAQIRRGDTAACDRNLYLNRIIVVPTQGVTVRPAAEPRRTR
ncbi:MAG: hypothetical protein G01um101438_385 [Parcubacteria group bacterium Gr01-1014_38]|nr:MAG: hypothetical protein G01um101438_385 [Parcubacteria group bacterium Gr01-1014_38]